MPAIDPAVDTLLGEFHARVKRVGSVAAAATLVAGLRANFAGAANVWQGAGERLANVGQWQGAAEVFAAAALQFPRVQEWHYWQAMALRGAGCDSEAERELRTLVATSPDHRPAALALAALLRESGRLGAATDVVLASQRACPDDLPHAIACLAFLRECGAHAKGRTLTAVARARWPVSAEVASFAGEFALATGDFAAAGSAARAVLDMHPYAGTALLRLAHCRRFSARDDMDAKRIESAWRAISAADPARIPAGFALGKVFADLGAVADAVKVLREANAAASRLAHWDAGKWNAFVEHQLRAAGLPRGATLPGFVPVFVVGMPRTGTTLVASLLARDGQVRNRGELNWIDAMYRALDAQGRLHDPAALAAAAALVTAQLRRDDAPARFYIDKNPLNFRYLGFIAALFPNARVIHCRRDARDTALSLWMQHFVHGDLGFSFAFPDIAACMSGHTRLMAHWRLALPDTGVVTVDYEALVAEPDSTLRRLRGALGLEGAAETRDRRLDDAITTASVWQARQAVYTSSVGRWAGYAKYLPELLQWFPVEQRG